ncbi:MAG: hypothetical protein HY078_16855 [Elusimicrobia bacterium]|nr:hypothetical protein [Elusimicrobiota bacterium]
MRRSGGLLSTRVTRSITSPAVVIALVQFPIYGGLAGRALNWFYSAGAFYP